MRNGGAVKATEMKIFIDGKEIDPVSESSLNEFHTKDNDGSILFVEPIEVTGEMVVSWDFAVNAYSDLADTMRSLPIPKKESWQGSGKRRKPRVK